MAYRRIAPVSGQQELISLELNWIPLAPGRSDLLHRRRSLRRCLLPCRRRHRRRRCRQERAAAAMVFSTTTTD